MRHKINVNKGFFKYRFIIKHSLKKTLKEENIVFRTETNVIICSNDEIRDLNKRFRGKDVSTDVLSFPANELTCKFLEAARDGQALDFDFSTKRFYLGDIAISLDKAKAQAAEYGHCLKRELAFLTIHGTLHILGYDHIKDKDEGEMRERQRKILKKLRIKK
ncbi:MAG: rRNA maturation RNase YbeY [Eubacteriales bacterium]